MAHNLEQYQNVLLHYPHGGGVGGVPAVAGGALVMVVVPSPPRCGGALAVLVMVVFVVPRRGWCGGALAVLIVIVVTRGGGGGGGGARWRWCRRLW